jgi:D-alanyl-D-alanine carboxypeptidase
MTSRIPDYLYQPAFDTPFAADPATRFTAARLVSYVAGLPLGPAGYHYTNTDYILAQMIIEKVTHDTYADQLTRRIITPLRLHTTCLASYTCPRPTPPPCLARPSAPGSCTCTSPAPACSSRSPPTVQPATTTSPT